MDQSWIIHFILLVSTENIYSCQKRASSKPCDLWVTSSKKEKRWKELKLVCNTMAPSSLHWWSQLWSLTTAGLSSNLQLRRQLCVNTYSYRNMHSVGMSEETHFYKNFNSCNVWMTIKSRKKSSEAKHTLGMRHRRQNGTSLWWQG